MGRLLEAMRSAVGSLLEQSVEWGRIEAAHQERKTAMRTNKVCEQTLNPSGMQGGGGEGMIARGWFLSEKTSSLAYRKAKAMEVKQQSERCGGLNTQSELLFQAQPFSK